MQSEIQSLEANDTSTITVLPFGKTASNYKWVYNIKHKSDGKLKDTWPN